MAQNAIGNSAGIFLQGSQNYSAAQNKIFDAISQAADMYQKMQMQKDANLNAARIKQAEIDAAKQKQLQDIMNDPEKVSMMIGSKYNADPSSVTPDEMAAFKTAQQVLSSKNMQDQYGNVRPAYTPITLGAMQPTQQEQPQTVADVLLPPPVIGQKQEVPATEFTQKPKEQPRGSGVGQTAEEILRQQGIEKPKKPEKMDFASAEQYKADIASYNDALKSKREELFKTQQEAKQTAFDNKKTSDIIDKMIGYNKGTLSTSYAGSMQPVTRVVNAKAAENMALLKQGRLRIAAPLAKQLGVNPTDSDFQNTLNQIFNENEDRATREKMLVAAKDMINGSITKEEFYEKIGSQSGLTGLSALPSGFKDMGNGIVVGPDGKKYKMQVK